MQNLNLHHFVVMKCYVKCYLREDEWLDELWLEELWLLLDELGRELLEEFTLELLLDEFVRDELEEL